MIYYKNLDICYEAENYYNIIRRDFKMTNMLRYYTEIINAIANAQNNETRGNKIKCIWTAVQQWVVEYGWDFDGCLNDALQLDIYANGCEDLIELTELANAVYDEVYRTRKFSSIITMQEVSEVFEVLSDIHHITAPSQWGRFEDYKEMVEDTLEKCRKLKDSLERNTRKRDRELLERIARGGIDDDVKGNK